MERVEEATRRARVLVADDEAPMRLLCSRILQVHGYRCDTAANGEEALGLLRRNDYDVLVVDLRMPLRSGLDLLRTLREEGRSVPALVISAYTHMLEPSEASGLADLHIVSVMQKPFTMGELVRSIERVLGRAPTARPLPKDGKDGTVRSVRWVAHRPLPNHA